MKALFITHDAGYYGAAKSLQLLLRNYRDTEIDLVIWKLLEVLNPDNVRRKFGRVAGDLIRHYLPFDYRYSLEDIRNRFGVHINNVMEFHLPFDYCYKGMQANPLFLALNKLGTKALWGMHKGRLYDAMKQGKYDYVYLNSLVLHPVINQDHKFIIHVREVFDGHNKSVVGSLKKAGGVIFIDEATKEPFREVSFAASVVLNNPIDMSPLKDYVSAEGKPPGLDVRKNVIFSMIGKMTEDKGTDFIIRCFLRLNNDNARLLIVGEGARSFSEKCRDLAAGDGRVIFWGAEPDILKVYAISDYILRGEPYQCVGRTVYEGLYAGCKVIFPGGRTSARALFEYDTFKDSLYHYSPRNEAELFAILEKLSDAKVSERVHRSNIQDYVRGFHEFVLSAIG